MNNARSGIVGAAAIAVVVTWLPAGSAFAQQDLRKSESTIRDDAGAIAGDAMPSSLSRLMTDSGGATRADDPLPPEQAFRHLVTVLDPFHLRIDWTIEEGYYLYRNSLAVTTAGAATVAGPLAIPAGTTTRDEYFGETQVFYSAVALDLPLFRTTATATSLPLVLEYQGCKTDSICYPPQVVELSVDLPATRPTDLPSNID